MAEIGAHVRGEEPKLEETKLEEPCIWYAYILTMLCQCYFKLVEPIA